MHFPRHLLRLLHVSHCRRPPRTFANAAHLLAHLLDILKATATLLTIARSALASPEIHAAFAAALAEVAACRQMVHMLHKPRALVGWNAASRGTALGVLDTANENLWAVGKTLRAGQSGGV